MLYVQKIIIKMDSFEINKIIAAILVTVIVVFGISKVSDIIFTVEKPDIASYKVEATEGVSLSSQKVFFFQNLVFLIEILISTCNLTENPNGPYGPYEHIIQVGSPNY